MAHCAVDGRGDPSAVPVRDVANVQLRSIENAANHMS